MPVAIGLLFTVGDAQAGIVTFSGSLGGSEPTFDRALAFINGSQEDTFTGYSVVGSNVYYQSYAFTVNQTDSYTFSATTNIGPTLNEASLTIYQSSFNPADSSINYLSDAFTNGSITYTLSSGKTYDLVVASDYNGDTGTFVATISAPTGTASAVPEPSSLIQLGIAVSGLSSFAWLRRRAAKQ